MGIVSEAGVVLDRGVVGVVVGVAQVACHQSPTIHHCLRVCVTTACCCFWVWEVTVVAGECQGFLVHQNLSRAMEGQLHSMEAE